MTIRYGGVAEAGVVLVRVEHNYGTPTAYPANANARLLAGLARTNTLRAADLRRIQALGFEVVVEERGADLLAMMGVTA